MEKFKNPLAKVFVYFYLFVAMFCCLIPFLWSFLNSIKFPVEANAPVPKLWGFTATFSNYEKLWLYMSAEQFRPYAIAVGVILAILVLFYIINKSNNFMSPNKAGFLIFLALMLVVIILPNVASMSKFYGYFINSIIVTIGTLVISISIACLGGYALARYTGIAGVIILIAALAFRALPQMSRVLPYYFFGTMTGLYDTHILLIIAMVAANQPFAIWMLRSFFMDIPKEIEEAAMIDGAGRLYAFVKIILPITWPGIITTSLFTLLLAYNEFLLPRILTQTNWPLPVAIVSYTSGEDAAYRTIAAAASFSVTLPIIFVVIIFQKYLIKGLTAGAVKG